MKGLRQVSHDCKAVLKEPCNEQDMFETKHLSAVYSYWVSTVNKTNVQLIKENPLNNTTQQLFSYWDYSTIELHTVLNQE